MDFQLKSNRIRKKSKKRIGRGGDRGKTSGRGQKGEGSRSGTSNYLGFEGGQTSIYRRLPKRGFKRKLKFEIGIVNLDDLNQYEDNYKINLKALYEKRLINRNIKKIKLLGKGNISKKLDVEFDFISKSALDKLKKTDSLFKLR